MTPFSAAGWRKPACGAWSAGEALRPPLVAARAPERRVPVTGLRPWARNGPPLAVRQGASRKRPGASPALHSPCSGDGKRVKGAARALKQQGRRSFAQACRPGQAALCGARPRRQRRECGPAGMTMVECGVIPTAGIFDSSCAGSTRAFIKQIWSLINLMDCRVKPGNDDVGGALPTAIGIRPRTPSCRSRRRDLRDPGSDRCGGRAPARRRRRNRSASDTPQPCCCGSARIARAGS
jgi:hypothetical protein